MPDRIQTDVSKSSDSVRGLHTLMETSVLDVSAAETLPPFVYSDQDVFEYEKTEIFMKDWLGVGRADQIPNRGDFFTITVLNEPLIIVRGSDGVIRALSAVCRHRGMIITVDTDAAPGSWNQESPNSTGNCPRAFRCPYHFWQYDLEGKLVEAPEMERTIGFSADEVQLPSFQVDIWEGFILVNFDPEAESISARLEPLSELISNWGIGDMVSQPPLEMPGIPWNWKIMHENSIEVYHVDRLHFPKHFVIPSSGFRGSPYRDDEVVITTAVEATHENFALNPLGETLFPPIKALTEAESRTSYWIFLPPTLLIGLNSDSAFFRIVLPREVGSTDLRQAYLVPREHLALPLYEDLVNMASDFHATLNFQDHMVNSNLHRGLKSEFATRGRYSWQEGALIDFNRWLLKRYRGNADEEGR